MRAKATFLGHPVHPMLIVFPLGLLSVAAIFDIIYVSTQNGHWADVSFWMIAAGIIGGLIAAVFGFIDWLSIPEGTRAKYIGLIHGLSNFLVVLLFIVSWFMRRPSATVPSTTCNDARVDRHCHSAVFWLARWRTGLPAERWR